MKTYEILFISSIFVICLAMAFYYFSTTPLPQPDEVEISDLTGKTSDLDSTISESDAIYQFQEMQKERKAIFLWTGIPLGIFLLLAGFFFKRKSEGPYLFIDREDDDEGYFFDE